MVASSADDEAGQRSELFNEVVAQADSIQVDGVEDLHEFIAGYFAHVALEDLISTSPTDLLGLALSHLRAATIRDPDVSVVDVFTPTIAELGWSNGHTVVDVVAADMPFLVDSLSSALSVRGRGIHLVIHPQFYVSRDSEGRLISVQPRSDYHREPARPEGVLESWIHFDIDRETNPDDLEALKESLSGVLRDVHAAVSDWTAMSEVADDISDRLAENPIPGVDPFVQSEVAGFMEWLADKHFTFLGYREYDLVRSEGAVSLVARPDTGLGILRAGSRASAAVRTLPDEVSQRALDRDPLILTKANSRATVHRSAYMDYVGVKKFNSDGEVIGEYRFLGLYSAAVYNQSVLQIPVVRAKVAQVMQESGLSPESHMGKDLLQFLETYPRDEMFQTEPELLLSIALGVLRLQERRRTRIFLRRDPYGRFMSCLVYLPRDRYTTTVRRRIEQIMLDSLNGDSVEYWANVTESVLARLHLVVRVVPGEELPEPDQAELLRRIEDSIRSWDDDLRDAISEAMSEEDATRILNRFAAAIPEAYKEAYRARTAVADIRNLDELPPSATRVNLHYPFGANPTLRRLKIYMCGRRAALSDILPLLQDMGAEVTDERPFLFVDPEERRLRIYDIGLVFPQAQVPFLESAKERFEDGFMAAWQGRCESDRLNTLILLAGLNWQEVVVLRAFSRYMRQTGSSFSPSYVERVLLNHANVVRLLIDLFHARFDPDRSEDSRQEDESAIHDQILAELDQIQNLAMDRILRGLLNLIVACSRTSYYRPAPDDQPRQVSFKFWPRQIPDLPKPRPMYEIWVYSPVVEGVHLRFALVARGGLRWSDRPEDFRTEILGLVKAQAVKNSVIVPAGAKGGFYAKQVPDSGITREQRTAGGRDAYRRFISGLLDLTDNRVAGEVVPPDDVVRHDTDDSYLVVAADKGTATFSDLANSISADYGFWLGDAFASGGSEGYDHKAMGITARGAWESVKRHFRELGVNTQTQEFSVVGIGDMSGDVFGNGMLLSDKIRLVGAFDHRHIFLDPNPDPEVAIAERRRLFELPRSSWDDYDRELISDGGGVFPRTAKSVSITGPVRSALGLSDDVESVTPAELIRLMLTAEVDLFWNGGIGTYVKAHGESDADVGDKSNDAVRVHGRDLRCRVIGEGGNLGLTQKGRIEAARNGVRLNTDAIDNSAGVDTSDHEVNLKILLDGVVADGDLTRKQRNKLLRSMTATVAELVLQHNYAQNTALGNSRTQSTSMLHVHARMIRSLEARGQLDRQLEDLPGDGELKDRRAAHQGLFSPELCVLMAYSKITLADALEDTDFATDPYFSDVLVDYFPREVTSKFPEKITGHPLAPQIITTSVVSELVNRGGITFAFRIGEETSAGPIDVVRAFTFAKDVFGLRGYWNQVATLDNKVSTETQSDLYLEGRRLLDRASRWLLQTRGANVDLAAEVAHYSPLVGQLDPMLPDLLQGEERSRMKRRQVRMIEAGVPEALALEWAVMLHRFNLLDVIDIAGHTDCEPVAVAPLYHRVSELFGIDSFLVKITALPREGRWQALARQALRSDLYSVLASLTAQVVLTTDSGKDTAERLESWRSANLPSVNRVRNTIEEISQLETQGLAELSVALRALRSLSTRAKP